MRNFRWGLTQRLTQRLTERLRSPTEEQPRRRGDSRRRWATQLPVQNKIPCHHKQCHLGTPSDLLQHLADCRTCNPQPIMF
ncbi:hypothetical protein [Nostoc sp.]